MAVTPIDYEAATPEERKRKRLQYGAAQGGLCWHCEGGLIDPPPERPGDGRVQGAIDRGVFPPGFMGHPIHLHHNHMHGLTIGAVHAWCNAWLWVWRGE